MVDDLLCGKNGRVHRGLVDRAGEVVVWVVWCQVRLVRPAVQVVTAHMPVARVGLIGRDRVLADLDTVDKQLHADGSLRCNDVVPGAVVVGVGRAKGGHSPAVNTERKPPGVVHVDLAVVVSAQNRIAAVGRRNSAAVANNFATIRRGGLDPGFDTVRGWSGLLLVAVDVTVRPVELRSSVGVSGDRSGSVERDPILVEAVQTGRLGQCRSGHAGLVLHPGSGGLIEAPVEVRAVRNNRRGIIRRLRNRPGSDRTGECTCIDPVSRGDPIGVESSCRHVVVHKRHLRAAPPVGTRRSAPDWSRSTVAIDVVGEDSVIRIDDSAETHLHRVGCQCLGCDHWGRRDADVVRTETGESLLGMAVDLGEFATEPEVFLPGDGTGRNGQRTRADAFADSVIRGREPLQDARIRRRLRHEEVALAIAKCVIAGAVMGVAGDVESALVDRERLGRPEAGVVPALVEGVPTESRAAVKHSATGSLVAHVEAVARRVGDDHLDNSVPLPGGNGTSTALRVGHRRGVATIYRVIPDRRAGR